MVMVMAGVIDDIGLSEEVLESHHLVVTIIYVIVLVATILPTLRSTEPQSVP